MKLTLPPVVRANWLLMTARLTSRSLAGTLRTLVAVGTASDASMLATMRPAAPRRGVARTASSPPGPDAGGVVTPPETGVAVGEVGTARGPAAGAAVRPAGAVGEGAAGR